MVKKKSAPESEETIPTRNKVAKVLMLSVSIGDEDSDNLMPDFIARVQEALSGVAKNATVTGSHYLIMTDEGRGQYCRVPDYDPATRDFRPGTSSPSWAGGSVEARVKSQQSAPAGTRDPEHLRTVEETLRARGAKSGRKLRAKSHTGDRAPAESPQETRTTGPAPDVSKSIRSAESAAESAATDAGNSLLLKLRAKSK